MERANGQIWVVAVEMVVAIMGQHDTATTMGIKSCYGVTKLA